MKIWWVGALLGAAAVAAQAADPDGHFAIKGAGGGTCAQFSSAREQDARDYYVYAGWIDGYVTGLNELNRDTYDLSPWGTTEMLAGMVDGYCRKSPDLSFHVAVRRLMQVLAADRLETRSPIVRVEHGGRGIALYEATLRRVQKVLAEKGLYQGKVDGSYDAGTREALERFQRAEGLTPSGLPDQMTLLALFRPTASQ